MANAPQFQIASTSSAANKSGGHSRCKQIIDIDRESFVSNLRIGQQKHDILP